MATAFMIVKADFDLPFGDDIHLIASTTLAEDDIVSVIGFALADICQPTQLVCIESMEQLDTPQHTHQFHNPIPRH
jgi:hypothetical protein